MGRGLVPRTDPTDAAAGQGESGGDKTRFLQSPDWGHPEIK